MNSSVVDQQPDGVDARLPGGFNEKRSGEVELECGNQQMPLELTNAPGTNKCPWNKQDGATRQHVEINEADGSFLSSRLSAFAPVSLFTECSQMSGAIGG